MTRICKSICIFHILLIIYGSMLFITSLSFICNNLSINMKINFWGLIWLIILIILLDIGSAIFFKLKDLELLYFTMHTMTNYYILLCIQWRENISSRLSWNSGGFRISNSCTSFFVHVPVSVSLFMFQLVFLCSCTSQLKITNRNSSNKIIIKLVSVLIDYKYICMTTMYCINVDVFVYRVTKNEEKIDEETEDNTQSDEVRLHLRLWLEWRSFLTV